MQRILFNAGLLLTTGTVLAVLLAGCETRKVTVGGGVLEYPAFVRKYEPVVPAPAVSAPSTKPQGTQTPGAGQASGAPVIAAVRDSTGIPITTLRKALVGTFKGSFNDCPVRKGLEVELHEVAGSGDELHVEGTLKTFDLPGEKTVSSQLDWPVKGTPNAATGYVTLNAKPPVAKPDGKIVGGVLGVLVARAFKGPDPAEKYRAFSVGLARDFEGRGWVGQLYAYNFECAGLVLERVDGTPSGGMPQLDARLAFAHARLATKFLIEDPPFTTASGISPATQPPSFFGNPAALRAPFGGTNWLILAIKLGHHEAAAALGRMYEFGLGVPVRPELAARYYMMASEKGNAAALEGMARLYAAGLGVDRDGVKSRQLAEQAAQLRLAAYRVCSAPKVVQASLNMFYEEAESPPAGSLIGMLGAVVNMDKKIEIGTLVIQSVKSAALVTADQPFLCNFTVRSVDTKITDMTPYRQYSVTEGDGRTYYYDNKNDIEWGQASASIQTTLANAMQLKEIVRVEPLGGNRYRLSLLVEGIFGGLAPYRSMEISL